MRTNHPNEPQDPHHTNHPPKPDKPSQPPTPNPTNDPPKPAKASGPPKPNEPWPAALRLFACLCAIERALKQLLRLPLLREQALRQLEREVRLFRELLTILLKEAPTAILPAILHPPRSLPGHLARLEHVSGERGQALEVKLDDQVFTFSPRPGLLLLVLAEDHSAAPDRLLSWRTRGEIVESFAKEAITLTMGSLDNLTWRLRGRLQAQGGNPAWVESRNGSLRLRLFSRREPPGGVGSSWPVPSGLKPSPLAPRALTRPVPYR